MRLTLACLVVFAYAFAGCSEGDGEHDPSGPGGPSDGEAASETWPTGILYRDPVRSHLAGAPAKPQGDSALRPGGFDVVGSILAQGDNEQSILVKEADGGRRTVATTVHQVARLSLDPTGVFAVVQATAQPVGPTTPLPPDLNVYRIDLADGSAQRIGSAADPEEGPEWSPDGTRIAFSSFSPVLGMDLHVVDAATLAEVAVFEDAGGLHLSFSRDGTKLLEAGRLRVLDVATGAVQHDLRDAARKGIVAAGYEVEDRHPGQANRGPFPLDGDFSPDGTRIVFDGAVKDGDGSAIVIATMALDGTGFEVVAGPFPVDPARTNGLSYSETNPMWA